MSRSPALFPGPDCNGLFLAMAVLEGDGLCPAGPPAGEAAGVQGLNHRM
jgi:hypothetical protein